jgi:hypothetical protein
MNTAGSSQRFPYEFVTNSPVVRSRQPGGENIWELLFPRGEHTGISLIITNNSRYIDKIQNSFQAFLFEPGEVDS